MVAQTSQELMKLLLNRIISCNVLKQAKDVMKIDLSKSGTMLDHTEVDVGFIAAKSLKELVHSKQYNVSK